MRSRIDPNIEYDVVPGAPDDPRAVSALGWARVQVGPAARHEHLVKTVVMTRVVLDADGILTGLRRAETPMVIGTATVQPTGNHAEPSETSTHTPDPADDYPEDER